MEKKIQLAVSRQLFDQLMKQVNQRHCVTGRALRVLNTMVANGAMSVSSIANHLNISKKDTIRSVCYLQLCNKVYHNKEKKYNVTPKGEKWLFSNLHKVM